MSRLVEGSSELLERHLPLIDRVINFVGRRRGFGRDDHQEFKSRVLLKLIQNEGRLLRQFQGKSSFKTYLVTLVDRLAIDYCRPRNGRWRPSARAARCGRVGIELQRMIECQGLTPTEAIGRLTTRVGGPSRKTVEDALSQISIRPRRRRIDLRQLRQMDSGRRADLRVRTAEHRQALKKVRKSLQDALITLSVADRRILDLRFQEQWTVPQISAATGIPRRRIYGRLRNALRQLRREMLRQPRLALRAKEILGQGRTLHEVEEGL